MSDDTDPADGYDRRRATEALGDTSLEVDELASTDRLRSLLRRLGKRPSWARRRVTRRTSPRG